MFRRLILILCLIISQISGVSAVSIRSLSYLDLRSTVRLPILYDDASLLRFVSRTTPLSDRWYAPSDLVSISGSLINLSGRSGIMLRSEARDALWEMAAAFVDEFSTPLTVVSGYRSALYQQRLWDLGRCSDSLCAPPGYSEHQLGLAVDMFDVSNETEFYRNTTYRRYIAWLQSHAHLYGWTQSYQKGESTDEYEIEPWHYRYVGRQMATRLHSLGWTYTEFVRFQEAIARR